MRISASSLKWISTENILCASPDQGSGRSTSNPLRDRSINFTGQWFGPWISSVLASKAMRLKRRRLAACLLMAQSSGSTLTIDRPLAGLPPKAGH
ncbi:hypothetical protein D3C73_1455340 [compost metagenome]